MLLCSVYCPSLSDEIIPIPFVQLESARGRPKGPDQKPNSVHVKIVVGLGKNKRYSMRIKLVYPVTFVYSTASDKVHTPPAPLKCMGKLTQCLDFKSHFSVCYLSDGSIEVRSQPAIVNRPYLPSIVRENQYNCSNPTHSRTYQL